MESRGSRTSCESRAVGVKAVGPPLVSREKGEGLGQTTLPAPVVVAKATLEEDPFVVKLDQSDPSHPKVCVIPSFFPWLTRIN